MAEILKYDNLTQAEISDNINTFLENEESYEDLFETKGMDLMVELLAGWGSVILFNNQTLREETHSDTVKADSSIAQLAIDRSYRVNRPTSPKIKVTYTGTSATQLYTGDTLGTYGDYDVVYQGEDISLPTGTSVEATIGLKVTEEFTIDKSEDMWSIDIEPDTYDYIENSVLVVQYGSEKADISTNLEYLYRDHVVDYSIGNGCARVYLYDSVLEKGIDLSEVTYVTVTYLEMDLIETFSGSSVSLDTGYIYSSTLSSGADPDNYAYVKSLLPFFNQTYRSAITGDDFNYLSKAFPYFKDSYYTVDEGTPLKFSMSLLSNTVGTEYTITATSGDDETSDDYISETHTATWLEDDTYNSVILRLKASIQSTSSLLNWQDPIVSNTFTVEAFTASHDVQIGQSNSFDYTELTSNVLADENQGIIYYTHINVADGQSNLTTYEQEQFITYLEPYKISGSIVTLTPADAMTYGFNLTIELADQDYKSILLDDLESLLSEYEYTVNTDIELSKIIRTVALFSYEGVRYVSKIKTTSTDDYTGTYDTYVKIALDLTLTY